MTVTLQTHTTMTLTPDYDRRIVIVRHPDGTTEEFPTRGAALAKYPELAPPPLVLTRAQERARDRQDRRHTGEIRKRDGRWS